MMGKAIFISLAISFSLVSIAQDDEWKTITPPLEFSFPRDHGSHPDYRTEWWYFTGQIESAEGRKFGYQFTIFRVGMIAGEAQPGESAMRPRQLLAGHFAIADMDEKTFQFAERFRRIGAGFADASEDDMHAWIGDWEIQRVDGDVVAITAHDNESQIGVEFQLEPVKPIVFQEAGGYSKKGDEEGNASAYLSWTRMKTAGTVFLRGEDYTVQGHSWFDHEWGSSQLGVGVEGWDWFGLHLDDGRDLMIYGLRRSDGELIPQSGGTLVDQDGTAHPLTRDDFTMTALRTWTSPDTNAEYPIEWRVEIPKNDISFSVKPSIDHAEMNTTQSLGVTYWEGPVKLVGQTTGRGYMELSGYATHLEGRF